MIITELRTETNGGLTKVALTFTEADLVFQQRMRLKRLVVVDILEAAGATSVELSIKKGALQQRLSVGLTGDSGAHVDDFDIDVDKGDLLNVGVYGPHATTLNVYAVGVPLD